MFDRSTDAMRRIVFHAIVEGGMRNGGTVGTEHLLIALLSTEVPLATRHLWARFAVTRSAAQALTPELPSRAEAFHGQISYSRRARRALEHALHVASRQGRLVHPEHLVYALLEDPSSTASVVIAKLGIDTVAIREHIARSWESVPAATRRRVIRLSPDYGCEWPLWEDGQVEPEDLALPAVLVHELRRWTDYWVCHFQPDRGWDDPAHCEWWHDWGHALAGRLQAEVNDFADLVPGFEWVR